MTPNAYTDPAFIAAVTGGIVAILSAANRIVTGRWNFIIKRPTPQDQLDKAVTTLIQHYQAALEQDKIRYRDHVESLNDQVEALREDLRVLHRIVREHGIDLTPLEGSRQEP